MKSKHNIQLSIPQPCSQDWDQMTPDAKGRFCAHCQKTVIDFTTWSDTDLYNFFAKNKRTVCGRFQTNQLDRTIQLPVQKPTHLYRIAIALGLGVMFSQLPATHARPKPPLTEQNVFTQEDLPQNDSTGNDSLVIKGTVLDGTKQPAVNAIVNVTYKDAIAGSAVTDLDGNFIIVLRQQIDPAQLKIKFLYTGHEPVMYQYRKLPQGNVVEMKFSKNGLNGLLEIKYTRPLIDNSHPGPNSTFTREQINNTAH